MSDEALLAIFMLGGLVGLALCAWIERVRRERRHLDKRIAQGMRAAWRRGWISDGDQ